MGDQPCGQVAQCSGWDAIAIACQSTYNDCT